MHQTRVASEHGSDLDWEFVARAVQVIVTKVEVADTGVAIEGVDKVPGALVADPAMRDI